MKKILLTIAMFITVMTLFFALGTTASAETYGELTYTVSDNKVTITDCKSSVTTVEIPSTIDGYPVVSIGYQAFRSCKNLVSVIIPDSITDIGEQAFFNCIALESVLIPDSVQNIGNHAFDNCANIQSVTIGKNVKTIGEAAFRLCESLISIRIPNNVVTIGKGVFFYCSNLKNIIIEDGAISIGAEAFLYTPFYEDENNWENGALYINNHLIGVKTTCSGNFKIKEGTLTIGGGAFIDCKNITDIEMPESLKVVGGYAFLGCDNLTSIEISDNVKSIGEYAFDSCVNLVQITMGKSVESIGNQAFYNCKALQLISLPSSLEYLGIAAFSKCASLESISLPENEINEIPISAFYGCSNLTKIYIPANITVINESAFNLCNNLGVVYYGGTEEDWNNVLVGRVNTAIENAKIYFSHSHTVNEWTITIPVGTYTDGLKSGICSQCSYECSQIIYADHKHNYITSEGKIPNCTENGYVKSICECGDAFTESLSALGHTPGEWEVVTEAQVGENGLEQQKCTVCGEVLDERVIPALPDVTYMTGDANGDGKVNAIDARIILRISAQLDKIENHNLPMAVFDLTGDGKVNALDARKALRIGAQLE